MGSRSTDRPDCVALMRYSPQFVRMFVEKLMTYAVGRGMEYGHADDPADRARHAKDDNRFSAIVWEW